MKVVVDLGLCDLHGLCVEAAPEVFEIGADGNLHVINASPPDALRAKGRALEIRTTDPNAWQPPPSAAPD